MKFKRGVSFWSYGGSYRAGRLSIEGMLVEIAKTGSTGVELLPNLHSICDYPRYTEKDIDTWFDLLAKYNLEPVCNAAQIICKPILDCGADVSGMPNPHYGASEEEMIELMRHEINLTAAFGFKLMRHPLMTGVSKTAIEETISYAEDRGVGLDLEIHSPYSLKGPEVEWQIDMMERKNTKLSGIIPDLNAFQDKIPAFFRAKKLTEGAEEELLTKIDAALAAHEDMAKFAKELETATENPATLAYLNTARYLNPNSLEDLRPLAKYINHFHTKFFDVDDSGNETTFDYKKVLTILKEIGFDGYLMTEYEGQMLHNKNGEEEVEQVARQHKMIERICAEL